MQDYNTIVGVIQMRSNECSFPVIRARYHIGTSTIQLILKRFEASGLTLEELRSADPRAVEEKNQEFSYKRNKKKNTRRIQVFG